MRALLATGLLLAASPAHAGENEITLGSFGRALRSSSANALTADGLGGASLGYARHLPGPVELLPGVELWGTADALFGGASGTMFQTLSTELEVEQYTVGARARLALHRRLVASARLGLGVAHASVALRDPGDRAASDDGWGAISTGSLGLELLAIARPRFSLGLRFDLGYVLARGIALTPRSSSADGTLELERMESSLGELDLSGRCFAMTLVSSF